MTPPENSRIIVTPGIERLAMKGAELFQRTAVASVASHFATSAGSSRSSGSTVAILTIWGWCAPDAGP